MQISEAASELDNLAQLLADPAKRNQSTKGLNNYINKLTHEVQKNPHAELYVLLGRVR